MPGAAEWSKRVAQWKRSGKSAREFAAAHGWKVGTLAWWSSRLGRQTTSASQVRLVPLECTQAAGDGTRPRQDALALVDNGPHRSEGFDLEVARGCVIRVRRGFDGDLLRQLVAALEVR